MAVCRPTVWTQGPSSGNTRVLNQWAKTRVLPLAGPCVQTADRHTAMVLRDLFRDVFQTLWAHKLRTALTMFGIAWGVISIVLMVAAGEGLRVGQAKVSENFGRDLMIIFAGRTSLQAGGTRAGRRIEYLDGDIPVVQADSPDCEWVLPELETSRARIHSNYNAGAQTVTGSYPPFQDIRSIAVAEGRFYDW